MVTALLIPELSLKVRNLDPSKLREAIEEGYEVRNQTPPAGNWKTSPGIVSGNKSTPGCVRRAMMRSLSLALMNLATMET